MKIRSLRELGSDVRVSRDHLRGPCSEERENGAHRGVDPRPKLSTLGSVCNTGKIKQPNECCAGQCLTIKQEEVATTAIVEC